MSNPNIKTQIIVTNSVYKTSSLGFSQAVVANGFVFISGQVGWDTSYNLIGNGDFKAQAKQCFKNLEQILKAANSSMQEVVHLRIFVTEMTEENKLIIANLLKLNYPNIYKPATTLLCVKALARESLKIEMETISNASNK